MEHYKFEIKKIPPTLTLLLPTKYSLLDLENSAEQLRSISINNCANTIVCLQHQEKYDENMKFQLCFPVPEADFMHYDKDNFYVMPRIEAVSVIHKGNFRELEKVFLALENYFKKNQLTFDLPYRIIIHKSRSFFHKNQHYQAEIQVPLKGRV